MRRLVMVVGLILLLTACGSTQTEEPEEEGGAPTSAPAPATTAAVTTTVTTETPAELTTSSSVVETTADVAGHWFACEFVETPGEPPTDDCAAFDDDGLLFDSDGLLVLIERVGGRERNCLFDNVGTCFESDLEEIEISGDLLGGWAQDGITIAVGTADCNGTIEREPSDSFSVFRPGDEDGCDVLRVDSNASDQVDAGAVYFGRYEGTVLLEG